MPDVLTLLDLGSGHEAPFRVPAAADELDEAAGTGSGRFYGVEHWQRIGESSGILLAQYDDATSAPTTVGVSPAVS